MVVSKERKSVHLRDVAFKVVMKGNRFLTLAFRSGILMGRFGQTEGDRGVCVVVQ